MITMGVPLASAAWRRAVRSGMTNGRTRSSWAKPAAVTSTRSGGANSAGRLRLVSTTIVAQSACGSPSTGSSRCSHSGIVVVVVGAVMVGPVVVVFANSSGRPPAVSDELSETWVESHVTQSPMAAETVTTVRATATIHPLTRANLGRRSRARALQAGGRGFESHRLHDLRLDRDFLGPAGASAATDRNQQWISRIARPGVDPTVRVESETPGSKRPRLVPELPTPDRVGPPSVTAELAAAGRDLERLRRAREDLDRGAGRWTHTRPAEPPTDSARHVKNARPPSNVHARRCGDANSATGAASPVSRPQRNTAPTTTGPPTRRRSPRNSTVGSPRPTPRRRSPESGSLPRPLAR